MNQALPVLMMVALAAPARADDPVKIKQTLDIVYRTVDKTNLKLDLIAPDAKGPHPLVVCVHGGGWRSGNKKDMRDIARELAKAGYAAAAVGYRLSDAAKFPAQIEDCKTAVRFLRTKAADYDIDPKRVGAVGFSAGGHLVSLLGVADAKAGYEGKDYPEASSRVQAVVNFFGPTDFAAYADDATAQNAFMKQLFGKTYKDDPKAHDKASPVKYVTKDTPPFLFIHGTRDPLVPLSHSKDMAKLLTDAGAKADVIVMDGGGHGDWFGDPKKRDQSIADVLKFFGENLKK